jgi:hypothetical protein
LDNQQPRKEGKNTMTKPEKLLTAITVVVGFETNDSSYSLLIAMREVLSTLNKNEFDSRGYLVEPDELEESFLALFKLWLVGTKHNVPKSTTMDDALTMLTAASVSASQVTTPGAA